MKLILSSNGFDSEAIIQEAERLVGKPRTEINSAAIAQGYAVETGNHRWVLDDLNRVAETLGGTFRIVNLLALNPKQIEAELRVVDVVFVSGGHTDYLMSVFEASGLAAMLPKLLNNLVYVGSSAGSMILGRRISTEAYQRIYGEDGTYGVSKYLEIVNFAMKPHLGSTFFPNTRLPNLQEVADTFDGVMYALPDNSALIVEDGHVGEIGEGIVTFNKNTT